jgi:chaperonin GroES
MAFKPLADRVLVRRVQSEEKTKGGLIIPDTAKEKPAEGEVVSVGEGARKDSGELIAPAVKKGDRILFGKWSGTEVTLNGEELLIMKESDILGIIGWGAVRASTHPTQSITHSRSYHNGCERSPF